MISIITNRKQIPYTDLITHLKRCVHPNVDRIILREKDLSETIIRKKIKQIKSTPKLKDIPLYLNGPYSLTDTYGANGRHYTMSQYRELCASKSLVTFKIGVSIHDLQEIIEINKYSVMNKYSVNYMLYGHIFPTACKAGLQQRGLDNLKILLGHTGERLVALGGINQDNYKKILDKNCWHFAMMSSVMQAHDPYSYLNSFSGQ